MNKLVLICSLIISLKAHGADTRLHLTGYVLPVSQVKIIQNDSRNEINLEASSNTKNSNESQKVYLTDMEKNIISYQSELFEEDNISTKNKILIKYATDLATEEKPIVFNIVSN